MAFPSYCPRRWVRFQILLADLAGTMRESESCLYSRTASRVAATNVISIMENVLPIQDARSEPRAEERSVAAETLEPENGGETCRQPR